MTSPTGYDMKKLNAIKAIAQNTDRIAIQLLKLNLKLDEKHTPIEYQLGEINKTLKDIQTTIWNAR